MQYESDLKLCTVYGESATKTCLKPKNGSILSRKIWANQVANEKKSEPEQCESEKNSEPEQCRGGALIAENSTWKNCGDVYKAGYHTSGVYTVKLNQHLDPVCVYCDHSDGGGWTVLQRRVDGNLLFNRTWAEYKEGFGDLDYEFWLGNDIMSNMTADVSYTVRIDLVAFNNDTAYAQYTNFKALPEDQKYQLQTGQYSGTAGETSNRGLSYNNGQPFTTIDRDNDDAHYNCAVTNGGGGGWWYKFCTKVNINGYYKHHIGSETWSKQYIIWRAWKDFEQLKRTEMKMRPI